MAMDANESGPGCASVPAGDKQLEMAAQEPPQAGVCPVVGIGASAGGLEAFRQLLAGLPEKTGMAFVLIQHLAPDHGSQLAELLGKATRLPVIEASDGLAISPDHVYVIPPNANLALREGRLHLTPREGGEGSHRLAVDFFFRSLAESCQNYAIGVILSGTGSDGSRGVEEIKAAGGITFAQDEDSAEYASMPQSAVASGHIDFVLNPQQIARELGRIGQHPYLKPPTAISEEPVGGEFARILARLRATTGVDFSGYRPSTLKRRVARRMALQQQESLSAYLKFLHENPAEVQALYRDLLINVTSFFRDPEVFEALKQHVFPHIVKGKSADNPIRIWVPGCSTGQEAYSLAMVLLEFLDQQAAGGAGAGRPALQIFGTDINDAAAVEKARPGIYPPSIEAEVSPERLQRFFLKVEGGYRISQAVRELCVFARQDVTSDPPFSRLDLISCRNLLIYLSTAVQQRLMPVFHYALKPGGFLLLGPSETVGRASDLFKRVESRANVYARAEVLSRAHAPLERAGHYPLPAHQGTPAPEHTPAVADLRREADRLLLGRFAPAAVLIDETLEILHFRGHTAPYLQAPSGQPTHNVLKMAHESLFMDLRSAIEESRSQNATARREVRMAEVEAGGAGAAPSRVRLVNLEVSPLHLHGIPQRCFLVLFIEAPAAAPGTRGTEAMPLPARSRTEVAENESLRQELASVKEYLQAIIEQQNAANEELQSANEEVRSANEELQSTNEELQTSKEELQSANEELRTVNDELQARNQEVTQTNDDFANTLSSIKAPIVMLGPDLRIRRFTPPAGTLLNLIPTDLGRPFADIRPIFKLPDLSPRLLEVIATVTAREEEVQDAAGRWYQLSMHPYRTSNNRIDGVVLVLRDIDAEKRTRTQLAHVSAAKDHFLAVLSHELRTPLTPVLATVAMLQEDERFDADTREQLEMIRRNAEMEAHLIDDLLDMTRIARGKIELDRRPHELATILRHAVEVCQPDIKARGLVFDLECPGGPYIVDADASRLQQVFWNLLRNAIKFTPRGGCVGIRCRAEGPQQVLVEVNDSGMGIKPQVLGGIFKAFEQGGADMTRQFGGLGLGLAISKNLVEVHGGSIEARSAGEGKGATFCVHLPLLARAPRPGGEAVPALVDAQAETRTPAGPLRILLVEDHGDTARILRRLLMASGHDVQVAGDRASALKLPDSSFDFLLSDLSLPDGSGLDLLREFRQRGWKGAAIALSGYGREEDIQRSREAGFVLHLTKPVSPARLTDAIAAVAKAPLQS